MTPGNGAARPPRGLLAALAGIAVLGLLVRVPSIAEPLAVDQGLWASAARGMSRGLLLYRDVLDQKPPGLFFAYLTAFRVFGWTAGSVAWLDLLASAATTWLIFATLRRLSGVMTGAVAAALYSVLTVPAWLFRYGGISERSIAETFILAAVAGAAWCAARLRERPSAADAIGLGFGIGVAIVFKPNAGVYLPALLLWVAYVPGRAVDWRAFGRSAALAALGAFVVPAATLLWLWWIGVWPDAWVALVDFNRYYVGASFSPWGFARDFVDQVGFRVKYDPLWLAGAVGAVLLIWDFVRRRRIDAVSALAVAWGGTSALVIAANGARLYPTYFLLPMPPLAMLTAWMIVGAARAPWLRRAIVIAACVLMAVLLARKNYPAKVGGFVRADLEQLAGRGDRREYLRLFEARVEPRGYSALANEEVAAWVRDRTAPGSVIYQFGINFSGVYFETDRLPANRFLRVNFFVPASFPHPAFQLAAVVREIAARRPACLIFEHLHTPKDLADAVNRLTDDPDVMRLLASYRLEARIEDFTLYRRVD